MHRGDTVYRFGDFELQLATGRLLRNGRRVGLRDAAFAILVELVVHAPRVLPKDAIARAGWRGMASDNSVEQAISRLRQTLGQVSGVHCIETVRNGGYRFVVPVEEVQPRERATMPDGLAGDAIEDFVSARRELATLNRDAIARARAAFERTLTKAPHYAPAHVGLSTACALMFEASRFDRVCHTGALPPAVEHARRGVTLDPTSGDGWSALGFALYLTGNPDAASVAAWKAVALEPGSWRHSLRLGFVSWGEERIEAAQAALLLRPHLALAHWLKATVFIARGAFDAALAYLRDGCAAQDSQPVEAAAYPAVGLHLLRGLVLAAQDRLADADSAFEAELAAPDRGQIYWQECAANTWYARGAICLRQREFAAAERAFERALSIAPAHFLSFAALGRPVPDLAPDDPRATDAAVARAVAFARGNRIAEAARLYREAIAASPVPKAGWILPVEPILRPHLRPDVWRPALTLVGQRAT